MGFNTILFDTDEIGIATITINRPKKLNALNEEVLDELDELFKKIQGDKNIKGILITGAGDKAFVAGADIKELRELNEKSGRRASRKGQQVFQSIENTLKPVIAAVNGYALGGGAELAMACHLRIAGKNAVFGLPETGLGLIPGYGGTQRLTRIVGRARALEIVLTTRHIDAEEALQIGLVNKVAEGNPVEESRILLNNIFKNAPVAIEHALKAVLQSENRDGYQLEAELFGKLCETDDFIEGTSAFLEKRKPDFKGE